MSDSSAKGEYFSQIPEPVLYADISDGAYRLYGALARVVDTTERVGFVLIKTLAKRLNRSESSVKRHMKELVDAGFVISQPQWVDDHGEYHTHYEAGWRQTANVYTLPINTRGGFNYDPPFKTESPKEGRGFKTERDGGSKTEPGVGFRDDLQYKSPSIPEPLHPRENPLTEVPLRRGENASEIWGEENGEEYLPASRQKIPPPPDVEELIAQLFDKAS